MVPNNITKKQKAKGSFINDINTLNQLNVKLGTYNLKLLASVRDLGIWFQTELELFFRNSNQLWELSMLNIDAADKKQRYSQIEK